MSTVVPTPRLGGPIYQTRKPPPTLARETRVATSIKMDALRRIPKRSFGWMKPTTIVYPPFGGASRGFYVAAQFSRVTAEQVYAAGLAIAALLLAGAVANAGWTINGSFAALALLGALALWAERQPVQITKNLAATGSVLPTLFAAAAYGPLDAMLVAAVGLAWEANQGPSSRWVVWTSHRAIGAGIAGLIVAAATTDGSLGALAAVVVLAATVEAGVDGLFGILTLAVRKSGSPGALLRSMAPITLATVPLYGPLIAILVHANTILGTVWILALFLAPLIGIQALYRVYTSERAASRDLKESNARLERANISFASALVSALDARDAYTAGHSAAVAVYARDIAQRLEISANEQQIAHLAGLLHDIGKVGLPTGLLEKTGLLTATERQIMQQHSEIGERILRRVEGYAFVATVVRHHHERIDGTGYPDQLAGDAIPLVSRIICVADAYNAMTSGRPYRAALSTEEARRRLHEEAGSQFDAKVVAAFDGILAGSPLPYVRGVSPDFSLDAQWAAPLVPVHATAA